MKYLLKEQKKDKRDFKRFKFSLLSLIKKPAIPTSVDLRPLMPPVFDQGQLGSCSANSTVAARMYLDPKLPMLSRLFQYYETRKIEGTVSEDSGATNRDAVKSIQQNGICEETYMPYDITKFTNAPSASAVTNAATHKSNSYAAIKNITGVKQALALKEAVIIGMKVYDSFESQAVASNGVLPMPARGESMLGGHSVLVVGYDETKQQLIVRNSWGESWGDKGYFYMPYDYFKKYTFDYWVVQ